jgi:hypothetical protein
MWEGKFSSLRFPQGFSCGKLQVDYVNVEDHDKGIEYKSDATISYTGLFRKGKKIRIPFTAKGMVMSLDVDGRHVTFTIESKSPNIIYGSYIVGDKLDYGQFYLQPEGSPPPPNNEQGCSIM